MSRYIYTVKYNISKINELTNKSFLLKCYIFGTKIDKFLIFEGRNHHV